MCELRAINITKVVKSVDKGEPAVNEDERGDQKTESIRNKVEWMCVCVCVALPYNKNIYRLLRIMR